MQIELSVLIAVVGCALSVGTFFIGRTVAAKSAGQSDGEIRTNVQYIKDSVDKHDKKLDKIAENYSDLEGEIRELKARLKALEDKVKLLHGGD
jgi:peptidoglycan hydrolase CwlO-like protein